MTADRFDVSLMRTASDHDLRPIDSQQSVSGRAVALWATRGFGDSSHGGESRAFSFPLDLDTVAARYPLIARGYSSLRPYPHGWYSRTPDNKTFVDSGDWHAIRTSTPGTFGSCMPGSPRLVLFLVSSRPTPVVWVYVPSYWHTDRHSFAVI